MEAAGAPRLPSDAKEKNMRAHRCDRVLLVNEDRTRIDLTGDALRAERLTVLLVPGFKQGVAALRSGFKPNVILVDLVASVRHMSRVTGFLQLLSDDPAWRDLPVLGTSSSPGVLLHYRRRRRLMAPSAPRKPGCCTGSQGDRASTCGSRRAPARCASRRLPRARGR